MLHPDRRFTDRTHRGPRISGWPPRDRRPRWERQSAPPPDGSDGWDTPWVQLRTFVSHPHVYPAMIGAASTAVAPGAWVTVYDKHGQRFGAGFFNPQARVPLRILTHGSQPAGEDYVIEALDRAMALRLSLLRLDTQSEAYRVIHSDGDGLSGLVVDRYGDLLSIEVRNLGIWQRLPRLVPRLHEHLGTHSERIRVDESVARTEGIKITALPRTDKTRPIRFRENGVRFEVDFTHGHKTGFFCDQRENRRRFARLVRGAKILDLCCYTGGFAVTAGVLGEAGEITGVDLDEHAIAQARRNANLNQTRIRWVHADAFAYARQMHTNGALWDGVILDPPKLIESRDDETEGWRKYEDLNRLAMRLVAPHGLLITCSCSGLLSPEAFERLVIGAAHREGRRLQFFDRTGAGPDHPVMSNCPESRYLKVLWARLH